MNTVTLIMLSSAVTLTGPPSLVDLEALPHSDFGRVSAEQRDSSPRSRRVRTRHNYFN
jgi:hypothetical protein